MRERLERNILRAGLRVLKGERASLEENIGQRAVAVDLENLVWEYQIMENGVWIIGVLQYQLQTEYNDLSQHIESLRQQRNVNIHKQSAVCAMYVCDVCVCVICVMCEVGDEGGGMAEEFIERGRQLKHDIAELEVQYTTEVM